MKIKTRKFFRKMTSVAMAFTMLVGMGSGYVKAPIAEKTVEAASTPQYRNVMYYGEWSIYAGQKNFTPNKIDGSKITHLNFAFLDVDTNGNVISCDTWADFENPNVGYTTASGSVWAGVAPAMIMLRNQYPNMKIGFSVGGWTRSGDFPAVAGNATARKNFAKNIAKAAHLYGYDFVDIDWEYPTADRDPDPSGNGVTVDKGCKGSAADTHNFTLLMQELRSALDYYDALDGKHYELSVAMSASPAMMAKIEYDQVLNIVDFANMMTYDLCGAWAPYTGHQTALYTNPAYDHTNQPDCQFSVDACVKYLYNTYGNSIDASKIVVGIAPYTRGWAGVQNNGRDPSNPGLYATAEPNSIKAADGTTSGTFAYSDIGSLISQYGLQEYYDTTAEAAYYYSPSRGVFFTCDNERSVTAKGKYVKNATGYKNPFNKPLGGLISWMASLDAANAVTNAAYNALYGNTTLPSEGIKWPTIDNIGVSISTSGNDYVINIKNNNTVSTPKTQGTFHGGAEANVLYYAETFAGTVSYPKYYIKLDTGETLTGSAWSAGGNISSSNGYTVVTDVSWPYALEPGATKTLTLTSSSTASQSKIKEIAIVKRTGDNGADTCWTTIYGSGSQPPVTTTSSKPNTSENPNTTDNPNTSQNPTTTTTTTTQPHETTSKKTTGTYPEWAPGVSYVVGDLVQRNGSVYECINNNNAIVTWEPENVPSLWKLRPDLEPGEEEQSTEPARPTEVQGLALVSKTYSSATVTWTATSDQIAAGQTYRMYINDSFYREYSSAQNVTLNNLSAGNYTIKVVGVLNGYTTNGASITVNIEEAPAPGDIDIVGFQISATNKGVRTVYSVSDKFNGKSVTKSGIVYGLADKVSDSFMYVGSTYSYVYSYQSTTSGKMPMVIVPEGASEANYASASSYAMTMKFGAETAKAYTQSYKVCAFAQLSDGSYVYSDIYTYNPYQIADYVYQGSKMPNQTGHDYLYNSILSVVDPTYARKDYDVTSSLVV